MKKIGILTFHRSINYGSFMQALALAEVLKKHMNYDVEIIDYNSKKAIDSFNKSIYMNKDLFNILKRKKMHKVFNEVFDEFLPLSTRRIDTDDINEAFNFIKENNYDLIVVGSDEIWKITDMRGFPNPFFLGEDLGCKKISYAASANQTNFDKLSLDEKNYIKKSIESFDYIGVRDVTTRDKLCEIAPNIKLYRNCDPTFMYEINYDKDFKEKLYKRYGIPIEKKLIGIMCADRDIAKNIKNKYGQEYLIVTLYDSNPYADIYLYDLNPFEWAQVFKIFEFVITTYFHGTIFSIKNTVPFITIDLSPYANEYITKINDLLRDCSLENQYFRKDYIDLNGYDCIFEKIEELKGKNLNEKYNRAIRKQQKYFENFLNDVFYGNK